MKKLFSLILLAALCLSALTSCSTVSYKDIKNLKIEGTTFKSFYLYEFEGLIMESLGKELDLDGNTVNQGISVYGNKAIELPDHEWVNNRRRAIEIFQEDK